VVGSISYWFDNKNKVSARKVREGLSFNNVTGVIESLPQQFRAQQKNCQGSCLYMHFPFQLMAHMGNSVSFGHFSLGKLVCIPSSLL